MFQKSIQKEITDYLSHFNNFRTGLNFSEVTSDTEMQRYVRSEFGQMDMNCDQYKHSAYRSVNRSCNNLNHPNWGAAISPHSRYLPAQYGDGIT